MIQKLKMLALTFSSLFIFAAPLAVAGVASADSTGNLNLGTNACTGTNGQLSGTNTQGCGSTGVSTFEKYVKFALNLLSIIVGIAAVVMIIIAGLRYVTSGGKDESVKGAKNTILYAIIGLVIVALAQIIVHFVLTETTAPSTS